LDPGLPRLRFSLLTLVLVVILAGACIGLWWRWAPWMCHTTLTLGKLPVESVLFSPQERYLVASDVQSSSVCRLSPEGIQVMATLPSEVSCGLYTGFSNDGSLLAVNQRGDRDTFCIWSTETASVIANLEGSGCIPSFGDWALDNRHLATSGYTNTAAVWDARAGRRIALLEGHSNRVHRVRFSPNGGRVATASADGTVRLWDAVTGQERACLKGHDWASDAAFSPDGRQVVTIDLKGRLRFWDAESGALIRVLHSFSSSEPPQGTANVSFLPDGRQVCSSGNGGPTRFWDCTTGQLCLVRKEGFSPDGLRTAQAFNGRAYVLDVTGSGEYSIPRSALATLGEDTAKAYCALFSPSGHYVAVGHGDGSVRLWVRRRPEWWWGIAWLQEFWVAMVSGCALVVIAARNLRRSTKPAAAAPQQPVADRL
jgi:WD40 repeat protein